MKSFRMKNLAIKKIHLIFFVFCHFGIALKMKGQDSAAASFPPIVDTVSVSNHKDSIQYFDVVRESPVFNQRKIPDTELSKIKKDAAYWYADKNFVKNKKVNESEDKSSHSFLKSKWFNSFIWILLTGGFIFILIWYLASGNINLFRKKSYEIIEENSEIEEQEMDPSDYNNAIQKAIFNKNYRLAVRLLYLQLLNNFSEKGIITLSGRSTNNDYISQLNGSPYYNRFFHLTRNFEYIWYGKFDLSESAFEKISQEFNSLNQQIQ